jgi:PAS domain S-box-containing protein
MDTETEAPAPAPAAPTAALHDATRRLDAIINNTTMAIFVMDERQQCAFMNRAAEELTGYRFEETQGRPLHDVIHNKYPDGRHYPLGECPIDRAFPERNQVQGEEWFVHKDGSFYPVAFTASPIRDDLGRPIGTIIEARAIAEDRAQQAALRETEERYRLAVRATSDAIWDWDLARDRILWNRALETSYGHRLENVPPAGAWWLKQIHPEDRGRIGASIHAVIDGAGDRWQGEYRFRRSDGSYAHVLDRGYVIRDSGGRATRMLGAMLDMSERKRGEAALRDSEERLRAITDSVDQMIWSTRADGHHDYFNQRWYDFTGVEAGATDGDSWNGLFHPDDRERTWDTWRRSLESGAPYHIEYRLRHRSGQFRWVLGRAQPVRDAQGEIVRWYGTCTDIQDLKEAETELRRTSALLHLIGDSTPDMIYAKDRDSRILYANRAAFEIIGRPPEQVIGHSDIDWSEDPFQARAIVANDQAVMASGETRDVDEAFTTPGGDTRHYRSVKSPLRDSEGSIIGLVGVTSDVTTRRQAEERERLLAREVDHRAKNLLAVVQSIVQLTRAEDIAGFTRSLSGRIQSLARAHSLLAASRWEGADLKQLTTEELSPFAARGSGRVSIAGPAIKLRPEAAQALALVIHELATNAAKYGALSGEAGQVEIEWSMAAASGEPRLCIHWRERGGPAVTGVPTRRGFGSTVMQASVERQLKGKVRLDWEPHGLTCELALPAEQIVAAAGDGWLEKDKTGAASKLPSAGGSSEGLRVLVLEDEALIAMQIEDALAAAACTVVGPATRIGEAFDLLYAHAIDAALLDVNVAGERSFAIADILAAKQIPFAFVTGFDAASTLPEHLRSAPVLSKPFETVQLEAVIAQLAARTARKS